MANNGTHILNSGSTGAQADRPQCGDCFWYMSLAPKTKGQVFDKGLCLHTLPILVQAPNGLMQGTRIPVERDQCCPHHSDFEALPRKVIA